MRLSAAAVRLCCSRSVAGPTRRLSGATASLVACGRSRTFSPFGAPRRLPRRRLDRQRHPARDPRIAVGLADAAPAAADHSHFQRRRRHAAVGHRQDVRGARLPPDRGPRGGAGNSGARRDRSGSSSRPRSMPATSRAGLSCITAISPFDVGQAVVVADNRVLAIEAAEGTDHMLDGVAALRAEGRIRIPDGTGVLVKAPKPTQDRRVDLPSIGPRTVEMAARGRACRHCGGRRRDRHCRAVARGRSCGPRRPVRCRHAASWSAFMTLASGAGPASVHGLHRSRPKHPATTSGRR